MRKLNIAVALLAGLLVPAGGHGQVPADAAWATIESANFRVTYVRGLEHLARRAAASAERAHAGLSVLVADAPRGTIDIVVADNVDFSNGYAMPFPSNRIVIYAKPPVDLLELQYTEDWIDMVVVHELAHTFHLDVAGPMGRALRTVFGRVPFSWPFFPVVGTPRWAVEGLAVGIESTLTGAGRIHGSYHEMVVRTAVLEDRMDDIDRLGAASPLWPGPARIYIYGSLFMDYLTRRYGPDATARIVRGTGDALIPPALWFGGAARRSLGVTFRTAYEEWQDELRQRYRPLAAALREQGLTEGEPLTDHGAYALFPRYSPDGTAIAYAANDWRSTPRVAAIDAASGRQLWSRRANDLAAVAWLPDGGVVTSDMDFVDRFRIHSDLHVAGGPAGGRITRNARLQHPDAAADGRRIVAVQNQDGTNRLVMVDRVSGALRALTAFDEHVHWTLPRFAPDGGRIAAGRWRTGGDFEIVVLDTLGRTLLEVTRSAGISDAPAWSPDGRWILFWSDRTGIPNLFAAEIGLMGGDAAGAPADMSLVAPLQPRVRQVTSVLAGAYHPDVSPDGRWIVYAAYRHDGFRLERIPFDTATWREPTPEPIADALRHRVVYEEPPAADAFTASVRAAVAAADTSVSGPRPYSPGRHLRPYGWFPSFGVGGRHEDFLGFWTYGADLVDRHRWQFGASVSLRAGQTQGSAAYTYAGLPARAVLGMHPTVSVALNRSWDLAFDSPDTDELIDQREDRAELGVGLTRLRWRARSSFSLTGEVLHRARHLYGFPPGVSLRDPDDDMFGIRGSASFSNFIAPPFSISRENGVLVQVTARNRYDRNPRSYLDQEGRTRTLDDSYREYTTWNAAYLALPLPGFARHVIATRASGFRRDGPGAATAGIGGPGGTPFGFGVPGLVGDFGGTARLLPVRGFDESTRRGTRAWTASAEYRAPIAILATALRPLPIFADRVGAALFLDAGHAWCDEAARCAFSSPAAAPLIGAGAELTTFLSIYGVNAPLRTGVALPLHGADAQQVRWYVLLSTGF
jgi:Tol biopolymer transport system component